ncbi:hypothetical protein [Cyclobacterium xiamenense]|uniref:hypothetical protein n=1 Tax=Cyclobacterium xiamenense TaxID=1297121 RepID=UPI0035D0E3B9
MNPIAVWQGTIIGALGGASAGRMSRLEEVSRQEYPKYRPYSRAVKWLQENANPRHPGKRRSKIGIASHTN